MTSAVVEKFSSVRKEQRNHRGSDGRSLKVSLHNSYVGGDQRHSVGFRKPVGLLSLDEAAAGTAKILYLVFVQDSRLPKMCGLVLADSTDHRSGALQLGLKHSLYDSCHLRLGSPVEESLRLARVGITHHDIGRAQQGRVVIDVIVPI